MSFEITNHVNLDQDRHMQCDVYASDDPGAGGAHHVYGIQYGFGPTAGEQTISFQNGPMQTPEDANGVTIEALLGVSAHRLECFQAGPYACDENHRALEHIKHAISVLHERTNERLARNVEGTHEI